MTIESIAPIFSEAINSTPQKSDVQGDFGKWMTHQLQDVNSQINGSEHELTKLATGESGNLHHVMLELEKSKMAFQLTLQIRNKLLEGYQDIMRMQV